MITPAQIRAGRGLLGWPARTLAERAGVHITTVERSSTELRGNAATLLKIRQALEAGGVTFLEGDYLTVGPGVRLSLVRELPAKNDKKP